MVTGAPALSTMWAQQSRFAEDFAAFARVARDAGYGGIEVSHSTNEAGIAALLRGSVLPVRSLHAPAPYTPTPRGIPNSALNLAAADEDERREAVEHTVRTIELAAEAGARFVVVHLGGIGRTMFRQEGALRRLHAAGRLDSDEAHAIRREAHRQRLEAVGPHLAAARRSFAELVEVAAARNVAVGLENRLHFHELPSAEETLDLLAGCPAEHAGYWHDTGHAEVQGRLGLIDPRTAVSMLSARMIGCHLHDVRGILDHRAPGNGDVDWSYIAAGIPARAARTCEIDQREPEQSLAAAIAFLEERGVLG